MNFLFLVPSYVAWHYSGALRDLFFIWRNFVWFTYHFFSIGALARTLFSPWRRLGEDYQKGTLDLWGMFETFIVNVLMRAVGVLVRIVFILTGLVCLAVATASLVPALIVWLALPLGAAGLFIGGIMLLL